MSGIGGGSGPFETMLALLRVVENPAAYKGVMEEYDAKITEHTAAERAATAALEENHRLAEEAEAMRAEAQELHDKIAAKEVSLQTWEATLNSSQDKLAAGQVDLANARSEHDRIVAEHQAAHEDAQRVLKQRTDAITEAEHKTAWLLDRAKVIQAEWEKKLSALKSLIAGEPPEAGENGQ